MEVGRHSVNFRGERICGDSILVRRLHGGRRTMAVLSDGMGHGLKANVLSTLTSSMLMTLMRAGMPVTECAAMILRTLPVCSVRRISYSTFTILDMDEATGEVSVVEYDNPQAVVLRGGQLLPLDWNVIEDAQPGQRPRTIRAAHFTAAEGDRIVVVSDGVVQSGQIDGRFRFGWGAENLRDFVNYMTSHNSAINADDLAAQVVSKAAQNDGMRPCDDTSCVTVHIRRPRPMMFISCPPALKEDQARLAAHIGRFEGRKAISGYRVAEIVAAELGLDIQREVRSEDPSVPAEWHIEGFDLVCEGIVTSNYVLDVLERGLATHPERNPATRLARMLAGSDRIEMVIGTMRGTMSEEWKADEFELRRNILRRIASLLETRYGKQVGITYI